MSDIRNRRLGPWDSLEDLLSAGSLGDTNVKCTWFESVASGTSGTITPPTGATILLNEWAAGVDVLVSGISSGVPTYQSVIDTEGALITGTLDAAGAWTISGTPGPGYPIALIYVYRIKLSDFDYSATLETATVEGVNTLALLGDLANELSGFPDDYKDQSTIAFVDGTRTFSVTPVGDKFSVWVLGKEFIYSAAETQVIPDTEGIHWIYFDSDGAIQVLTNPTDDQQEDAIKRNALISYILWDATNSTATIFADERHGLTMDGATHYYLHDVVGFRYGDGLEAGDITADGGTGVDTSATISITDGALFDEDIKYETSDSGQSLTTPAQIPVYYIDGVAGTWRKDTADNFPVKNFVGGSGRLAYNSYSAPNYSQTEISSNNDFVLCHIFAVNDISEPIIAIQGQAQYGTLRTARLGAETEMLSLQTIGLPAQEYAPLYTIIYQTSAGYSNTPLARIRTTDTGDDYIDWRNVKVGAGGGGGSGDVVGPSSATDNAIARFDLATGKVIQDSSTILDDSGNIQFPDTTGLLDAAGNVAVKINSAGSIEFYFNNIKEGETFSGGLKATNSFTIAATTNVTGILDEDNMVSDSAVSLATQQSIKAYVDNSATGGTLTIVGGAGGNQTVILDSQTLTLEGGTGIDTTGSAQKMSFAIDSTVATLTGTQILTNKTLTSPIINTILAKVAETGISIVADGAVSLYHDASVKFATSAAGATLTGILVADGLTLGDNEDITLGAGPDAKISSNGTAFVVEDGAGSETMIKATPNGAAELYHNNTKRIETTDYGVKVTDDILSNNLVPGNKIINGNFDIWQRGTTFTSIASGKYSADRYAYYRSGAMVQTISRTTTVPTLAESGHESSYSLRLSLVTQDTSIADGDYAIIRQIIEGYNIADFMDKVITLSFWVRATTTGTYCVSFKNTGNDRSYISEYTISSTNTWEKKTITLTMHDGSSGTWNIINGQGLAVGFTIACGATFQTTADAWQTGNYFATANQVNGVGTAESSFYLSQIKLEVGSVATPFRSRIIGDELNLCERYYQEFGSGLLDGYVNVAAAYHSSSFITTALRASPTITEITTGSNINLQAYGVEPSTGTSEFSSFNAFVRGTAAGRVYVNDYVHSLDSEL